MIFPNLTRIEHFLLRYYLGFPDRITPDDAFYLCHLSFWKWCKIKNTSGYRLTQKNSNQKMFTTHYDIKIALSVQQTKLLKLLLEVHTKLSF